MNNRNGTKLRKYLPIIGVILLIVILGLVGNEDAKDAASQQAEYCDMVASGAWGNYNPDIDCSEVENGHR